MEVEGVVCSVHCGCWREGRREGAQACQAIRRSTCLPGHSNSDLLFAVS